MKKKMSSIILVSIISALITGCGDGDYEALIKDCMTQNVKSKTKCACEIDYEKEYLTPKEFSDYADALLQDGKMDAKTRDRVWDALFNSVRACRNVD